MTNSKRADGQLDVAVIGAARLCEALAVSGVLVRRDDGTFANTPAAEQALVPGAEFDQTDIIAHYRGDRWVGTEFEKAFLPGFTPPEHGYKLPESGEDRTRAADSTGRLLARALFSRVSIAKGAKFLDLGGGSGIYPAILAWPDPAFTATVVEIGYMADGARKLAPGEGLS